MKNILFILIVFFLCKSVHSQTIQGKKFRYVKGSIPPYTAYTNDSSLVYIDRLTGEFKRTHLAGGGGGGISGSGSAGQVAYWNGATSITGTNSFWWDNTNTLLRINGTTSIVNLHAQFGDSATTKAILLPRVQTTAGISGLLRQGMFVYSIADSSIYFRTLFGWKKLALNEAPIPNSLSYNWLVGGNYFPAMPSSGPRIGTNSTDNFIVTTNAVDRMTFLSTGEIGIGTSSPTHTLHIAGNLKYVDGNQGLNKVLTSDANGVATWQTPSAGSPPGSNRQVTYNNAGAFGGAAGVEIGNTNNRLLAQAQAATDIPLIVKGAAAQSARLQSWQNSAGTEVAWITSNGTNNYLGYRPLIGEYTQISGTDIVMGSVDGLNTYFVAQANQAYGIKYRDNGGNVIYQQNFGSGVLTNSTSFRHGRSFHGGSTSPTALIHIAAGTATAGFAPLKFTSGTNLTTPEAGAMEFDGSNVYFTPSTVRKRYALTNNATPTNGQIPIGNGTDYTAANITAGTNITVTNGAGTITIDAANQYTEGFYTPTLTNTTNVAASTAFQVHYARVGTLVTMRGKVNIDPTATGAVELRMSLPLSPGLFANDFEAGGTAVCSSTSEDIAISAVVSASVLAFKYTATSTANNTFFFVVSWTYIAP